MKIWMGQLATVLLTVIIMVAGCAPEEVQPASMQEPSLLADEISVPISAVVMGYAERLNAGDLQGALAYFDDGALFYILGLPPTGTETLSGKEQIRTLLADNIANHFRMEVEVLSVINEVIVTRTTTWHDYTREIGVAPVEATEVYVIEDGKITTEAWHVSEASLAKLKPFLAEDAPVEVEAAPTTGMPVVALTVTFEGGTCRYDGPKALQAGKIAVTMDVHDREKAKYGLTFFNLRPGKSLDDLIASTILESPPSWAEMITFPYEALPGERNEFSIKIDRGPVYLVCWSRPPDLAIGSIGPFEVVE